MDEVWKDIPGYEGLYQVSNMGRVKALQKGGRYADVHIMKPIIQHSGYAHIGLFKDKEQHQMRLHRIVAFAFCHNDDPINKTQVNHINENKLDNRSCNLEWVTAKQNTNYGGCIARRIYGREKSVECLSKEGVYIRTFKSQAEANAWCGVARNDGHIASCCNGKQKTAYGHRWRYAEKEVMPNETCEKQSPYRRRNFL